MVSSHVVASINHGDNIPFEALESRFVSPLSQKWLHIFLRLLPSVSKRLSNRNYTKLYPFLQGRVLPFPYKSLLEPHILWSHANYYASPFIYRLVQLSLIVYNVFDQFPFPSNMCRNVFSEMN